KQNIIPKEDSDKIVAELRNILSDIEDGKIEFEIDAEDIHMNIEKILIERIGDAGKRLHTGRSRNDQVAIDIRMYLMDETAEIEEMILNALEVIVDLASQHTETIMPGYTHLQKAQPVTFAHHLMAYFEMFKRDLMRLRDCRKRTNVMPLGSGALAGTTYPLDREFVADQLGFDGVSMNSLDGCSDMDFVIELASCLSLFMMHLSRFSEELILWSSHEFSFVEMDDAFSTGSSIMPQKKNPDVAELIRGKTGRVYGHLMGLLTTMKGIPLAYNKDMQEDKEPIFDAIDTVKLCLPVFCDMIATMTVKKDNMLKGSKGGFTNATDVADYLVKKGLPFREAHAVVGRMVFYSIEHDKSLDDLTMNEYKEFSDIIEEDIYDAISMETCVNDRKVIGGPAKEIVEKAINKAKNFINQQ
ncbi:MAG: argininosuccinate lyase, partial [Clostridia bacterium]|nr:argininosuccinate lyase [Clostridia bacterium]